MNRDDIIRMAIEAGVKPLWIEDGGVMYWGDLHRFADVVAAEQVPDIAIELARYKALAGELAEIVTRCQMMGFLQHKHESSPTHRSLVNDAQAALAKYDCFLQEQQEKEV